MRRKPKVQLDPVATRAAKKQVTAARKVRLDRRRQKHARLVERLDRLRYLTSSLKKQARIAQARVGILLYQAEQRTRQDAKSAEKAPGKDEFLLECVGNRPLRLILHCAEDLDLQSVEQVVIKALKLGRRSSKPTVEYLYPKLVKRARELRRYISVTLPCNRRRGLADAQRFCDAIWRAGRFVSVRVEGLRSGVMSGPPPTGTGPNYSMAEPSRRDWHLTDPEQALFDTSHFGGSIDLYGAWGVLGQNAGQNGADAGNGTVIGHPDSGFQPHSDYPVSQVDEERAYNAFEDRITPESLAVGGLNVAHHPFAPLNFPYYVQHGTYTASVIAAPQTNPTANETVGVAPGATILPLRCVDTVVLAGDYDIVRAIEHAVASDVDVISISLGGAPNPALLDALRYAIGNGTIVIAASGQGGGVAALPNQVAVPAAWAEVIAVAGSIGNRAWFGCFNGPEVDFCAPAVQINHATFSSQGVEGNGFGSGTSFAAAITAGVAALWLQHHGGRAAIEAAVPGVTVQQVFRHLAKQTAYTPAEFPDRTGFEFWRGDLFGSGILHARRLLEAGLPDPQDVPGFERFRPPNTYVAASGLALTGTNGRDVLEGVVWLMGAAGAIASAAATTAATTGQIIGDFISNVTAGVGAVGTSFAANWFGAVGAASPVAGAALAAANAAQAWQDALAAAGSVGGDLGEWLSEQADAAEEAWNAAEDAADEALEGAEEAVEDFVEETSEFIEDVAEEASETGSEIVDDVVGALNSLFG